MHAALPATHFATSVETLCSLIARHGLARLLAGKLIVLIWGRVRRIGAQVETLLAHMQAGRLRRYPARRAPRPTATPRRRPAQGTLPRKRAWLIDLIPETAACAAQVQTLLADPNLAELFHAAPQLRRALRPLCHMLGVRLPSQAAPPDTAPQTAAPAANAPPPEPPPGPPPGPPAPQQAPPKPEAPPRTFPPPLPA